ETLEMLAEASHDIQLAATMIESFIKRVRLCARKTDERLVEAPLAEVVDTALLMMKPRLLARGMAVMRPTFRAPVVPSRPARLTRALLNVLPSAPDPAPESGAIGVDSVERADAVGIVVDDQDPGLPAQIKPSVDEPFFTTKPNGTGLGLMV